MKQAYLIIAHKDDLTFRTLISMLDNENNDIFIHMDKKSKWWKVLYGGFCVEEYIIR